MSKQPSFITQVPIDLDPKARPPLYQQLYAQLRRSILSGRLQPSFRLPPTRALAAELEVSRNTVVNAFEQLIAEGYLAAKTGSGTFVSPTLPDEMLGVRAHEGRAPRSAERSPRLSRRGAVMAGAVVSTMPDAGMARPFRPGVPALDEFPLMLWSRLVAFRWQSVSRQLLGYGDPAGYMPLREALVAYLAASRGVRCTPEQVVIVAGSQQAIDIAARLLLNPNDPIWFEDPGYLGARAVLLGAGARVVGVPVDDEGLDMSAGIGRCPKPRMVYVTPSHQYPLGVTMSLARRLALLEWANRTGAWILEDDYDSEYRYTGRPLAALQGLDAMGRVIYIGTFSKVLFPALRLGYVVVPPELSRPFATARSLANRHSPLVEQAALADFLAEGHFARHIRRMRVLYAERQTVLKKAAERELATLLDIKTSGAGMHVVGWLPAAVNDLEVAQHLLKNGIEAPALSQYALAPLKPGGLILGYAGFTPRQIRTGIHQMRDVLHEILSPHAC